MTSLNNTTASWLESRHPPEWYFSYTDDMDREAYRQLSAYRSCKNIQLGMCYRTWGYVVLRTVYGSGSDDQFQKALSNLVKWVRFSIYDTLYARPYFLPGITQRPSKTNPKANDMLFQNFSLDVVEDEANLSIKDPEWFRNETENGIPRTLCNYYRNWLSQRGLDPDTPFHPRFTDVLVIDEASLSTLLALPEPPPGGYRQPVDPDDMMAILDSVKPGLGFVWLLDTNIVLNKPKWILEDPNFSEEVNEDCDEGQKVDQGVMQVQVQSLRGAWFQRLDQADQISGMKCEEVPEDSGSGVYEYVDQ